MGCTPRGREDLAISAASSNQGVIVDACTTWDGKHKQAVQLLTGATIEDIKVCNELHDLRVTFNNGVLRKGVCRYSDGAVGMGRLDYRRPRDVMVRIRGAGMT